MIEIVFKNLLFFVEKLIEKREKIIKFVKFVKFDLKL